MIFVTVGACYFQFDRLLRAVDELCTDEELVVQHGPSEVRPRGASCVAFMPLEEIIENVLCARAVVTHGGIGSILVSLSSGKRPIVVPRIPRYGEIVDDHQVTSAHRFEREGLVTVVDDPADLAAVLLRAAPPAAPRAAGTHLGGSLVSELRDYLLAVA